MSNEIKKVIGIDLGTSNSAVAVIEAGKAKVIPNNEGTQTTPSVVFIKGDEKKIGNTAKRGMVMNPKNTISFVKRFMGSNYNDEDVQRMIKMATYDVANENGLPRISIDGKTYSPEQISSMILANMYEIAKGYYGTDCKDAVITVPAWFNDAQRNATKLAGQLAGLNVLRIINEPTAAVLSSNIDTKSGDKIILVNDLGGGTEDVSVVEISDGMVEVLASDGDVFLGGQNYDNAIVQWLVEEFKKDTGVDLTKDKMAYARLVEAAEKAKCELSTSTQTEINLPYITVLDGVPQMLMKTLNRATFERLTESLTGRVIEIAKRAIEKAKIKPERIDEILLVGGSSRIPAVQEALSNAFNKPLNKTCNFDEAVALGAAIQANTLAGNATDNDILLVDVTPISLGIEVNGCEMAKLIEANTTIPAKKSQTFTTAVDNQPAVTIKVLQGERPMSADNKVIGTFNLEGIAPAPKGVPQIEVTFDINADGILEVTAKDKGTNKEQKVTIQSPNALSEEEIARIKADAEKFADADKKKKEEITALNTAEQYANQISKFISDEETAAKLSDTEKSELKEKVNAVIAAIDAKDVEKAKSTRDELEKAFKPVIEKIYAKEAPQEHAQPSNSQTANDMFQNAGFGDKTSGSADDNVQEAEYEEV
ncbi:MAG: hypothetical protein [Hatfieldvirus porci]|uniref:Chaperone protein DnaK n=1 Tax=phage Lak_Megaphage_RVC_JS4_GC31 TaxID=3109228 RepID=A0ABZ0Z1C4_9CAUD|nr:MAG: hypothetical protein [phage Lak_Megaphage_RVC_AP3_GC31]WQJ52829.1 MAG: hypothetical protein [phage Lak_Megaphage_RVC_JS4_GC31]